MGVVTQVPASLFGAVTSGLEKLNIPPDRLAAKNSLPLWHQQDPRTLVPGVHYYRLYGSAARAFGSECFGGVFPKHQPIGSYGVVGRAIGNSVTLFDAISTVCTIMNQVTNIAFLWTVEDVETLWWLCRRTLDADRGVRQIVLANAAYMIEVVRLGAGPDWRPAAIVLESDAIPGVARLEQFADADLRWRQETTGIAIPRSLLARRIAPSDPGIERATDDPSAYPAPADTFVASLRQAIGSHLHLGHPRIAEIADAAGSTVRTLQRRIAREGLTFKRLVDQTRFLAAAELMRDPGIPLVEVAHDLGYSDQAHFNHAFRRWAGTTPCEYRRQMHPC